MSRITNILNKIRLGFTDARYVLSKIPEVIQGLKRAPEKKLLRAKLHQMTDVVVDTYGDLALSLAKNLDVSVFQNLVEDIALLFAKYQEPIKAQLTTLAKELKVVAERHNDKTNQVGEAFGKIIMRVAKREGWTRFDMPSDKTRHEEREAKAKERYDEETRKHTREASIRRSINEQIRMFYTETTYRLEKGLSEGHVARNAYEDEIASRVNDIVEAMDL